MHACPQCGGVWLDNDNATRMVQAYEADALALADQAASGARGASNTAIAGIPCAVCSTAMQVCRVYEVDVDVCSQHGTWFDAHELRAVSTAMARSRQQRFQGGQPRPRPVRGRRPAQAGTTNDDMFVAGFAAADMVDVADVADVGIGGVEVAASVAGSVAEGGAGVLGGAFEIVGGILGGLLDV